MKKRAICLAIALFAALCFAGCDSYVPLPGPSGSGGGTSEGPSGGGTEGPDSPGYGDTADAYTVSLTADGKRYVPSISMSAIWTGTDGSKYSSEFDRNGNATLKGNATGNFNVTLSNLPAGYSYAPNSYTATASQKKVTITLVNCLSVSVRGTEPSVIGATTCVAGNVYRATFKSADDVVWFLLDPCDFETWCPVSENKVTPKLKGYIGNAAGGYYNPESVQDIEGGGPSGTFTENIAFRWNEGMGSLSFFIMQAESQKGYPVDIDFKVSSPTGGTGGGGQTGATATVGDPSLLQVIDPPGTFRYNYEDTFRVLQGDRFKLFPRGTTDSAGKEGDDYWHLYDKETDVYGAIVFAKISQSNMVTDIPFTDAQMKPLYAYGKNYTSFIDEYAAFCNRDGAHPVTEELRVFLQGFAINSSYFDDGEGWAEEKTRLFSTEENQWLYCCGYYV